ncbi:MAG: SDR family oxidoreductase [Candidatus Promineofilum sp.]|nr:SDR family oxidoreductase [Promineifilum sp.]MCW5865135.1 SDR family oxidoreductase [Anaerolineae bacterium]
MQATPSIEQLISLEGKRALITGAAGGIGRAIAWRYAEAGAELQLVDVDAATLRATAAELEATGYRVTSYVIDLSRKEQIDTLWAQLAGCEPDILVNNAGVYPFREFAGADEAFCRQVMEINYFSVSWMCQQMICRRHKRGGVIINLGSIEAVLPFKEDLAHYSVSKAGVIALTRALAKEYARHGFRVNAILPGGILTPGTKAAAKQVLRFRFDLIKTGIEFSQRLPVGRVGQPDEVARLALVLASDLATYVHGVAIPVDGGFLAA